MTRGVSLQKAVIAALASAALVVAVTALAASEISNGPLAEIERTFPGSLHAKAGKRHAIEFCPDNTCDSFVGDESVSRREMADFAYLYLFYFSDYFVLEGWRSDGEAGRIARGILARSQYAACRGEGESERARCVVRRLARGGRIRLYGVRYDEERRTREPLQLP